MLLACILVSKVHFSALTRGLKPVFVIVIFTAVMNLFFTGGTPVCDVWLLRHITWEGIWSAGFMVVRIVMLIMGTFLLTYTTSPISLTDELATAMECRCYHGGEGRTALHVLRYRTADYLVIAGFVLLVAGIIALKKCGL